MAEPGACISVLRRNAAEQSPWVGLLARRGQSRLPCASLPRPDSVEWLLKRRTSLTVAEPRRIYTGLPCYVPEDTLGKGVISPNCAASTLREILNACSSALRGSTYAKPGTTTIDGQNIVWGDNVVWGNNVVSGDVHQLP